jgi:geranylgeranyl reductase family protein
MIKRHDVIVIGAGPAGSASAYYLAQHGISALLLDKAQFPRDKTCGDGLTPRALAVLDDMGLLTTIEQLGYKNSSMRVIAPSGKDITLGIRTSDPRYPYMLVVPRMLLDDRLRQAAVDAGASFQGGCEVLTIEQTPQDIVVYAQQAGQAVQYRARLLIIATGASIKLLRSIGIIKHTPPMMLAARTYYQNLPQNQGQIAVDFKHVPLPGYGWIFPNSATSANIGAGIMPSQRTRNVTGQQAFRQLLNSPEIQNYLQQAQQSSPIKGFPLRTDFDRAPSFAPNILLVGEAVGLTNPLTGEGIDYALESGRIAAQHASQMIKQGSVGIQALQNYNRELRHKFQAMFVLSNRLRGLYLNPFLLNRVMNAAQKHPDINRLLSDITIGNSALHHGFSPKFIYKILSTA